IGQDSEDQNSNFDPSGDLPSPTYSSVSDVITIPPHFEPQEDPINYFKMLQMCPASEFEDNVIESTRAPSDRNSRNSHDSSLEIVVILSYMIIIMLFLILTATYSVTIINLYRNKSLILSTKNQTRTETTMS
ncbi:unnamed protein product, partial [Larinioides sclopetarius]